MSPEDIYRRYGSVVYRRARRLLGQDQAARDACQEVFMRVFRGVPALEQASVVTWLYKITTNHCLNVIRDERRHRTLLAQQALDAGATAMFGGRAGSPLSLSVLLRGFPEELQEVAIYYFIDEMSQDEIAAVLGISQRTVSNRLSTFRDLAKAAWSADSVEAT